jgi:hypothetical protein
LECPALRTEKVSSEEEAFKKSIFLMFLVRALIADSNIGSYLAGFVDLVASGCRWALYPPGRVPPAVIVHVDEDDGSVNFDGPTSLQVKQMFWKLVSMYISWHIGFEYSQLQAFGKRLFTSVFWVWLTDD